MSSRALSAASALVIAACGGTEAPPRERVLARIPATSIAVLAADGSTLAHPRLRAVIDVLRPVWPTRLGCAIDAALSADHVALGISASRSATLVIETHAKLDCPALTKLADRMYVATLGDAQHVEAKHSVLHAERFVRARPYLATAPIALTLEVPGGTAIATASVAPLEAWIALDVHPLFADVIEKRVRDYIARQFSDPATLPFAKRIAVTRTGSQIVATLDAGKVDADLAVATRALIAAAGRVAPRARAPYTCPPIAPPLIACRPGNVLAFTALGAAVTPLIDASLAPVVANGVVDGLRLTAPIPALGLLAGDVVVAAQGRKVAHRIALAEILRRARGSLALTIVRDGTTIQIGMHESS
jgi:hypothetical protein